MTRCRKTEGSNSWDRREGEGVKAYEAFKTYLEMGDDRTLHKVAEKLSKTDTLIKRWSYTWDWVERSRDYDNELGRQDLQAQVKELKKMRKRQAQTAQLLQKKALEQLNKTDLTDMKPKDLLQFIIEGARLERTALLIDVEEKQESDGNGVNIINDIPMTVGPMNTGTAVFRALGEAEEDTGETGEQAGDHEQRE